jgi:hypothetical protein
MLFNENRKPLPFVEELRIIRGIVDELKVKHPKFEFKLILTSLKMLGKSHLDKMINHIKEGTNSDDKKLVEMIAGFDMVNEEDFTAEISAFAKDII